jgi:hypothetical protein
MKQIAAVMAGLILLVAAVSIAQTTQAKPETGSIKGTIESIDGSKVVVSHRVGDHGTAQTTFVLNADTKKEGSLKKGTFALVAYKVENNQKIATLLRAM